MLSSIEILGFITILCGLFFVKDVWWMRRFKGESQANRLERGRLIGELLREEEMFRTWTKSRDSAEYIGARYDVPPVGVTQPQPRIADEEAVVQPEDEALGRRVSEEYADELLENESE